MYKLIPHLIECSFEAFSTAECRKHFHGFDGKLTLKWSTYGFCFVYPSQIPKTGGLKYPPDSLD